MNTNEKPLDLADFVDKLLEEKNLPDLPAEVKDQMKLDLISRVEDRINAALIGSMTPEQMTEFNVIADKGDEASIQQFFKQSIPDLETVVASALINFRATYLGLNT